MEEGLYKDAISNGIIFKPFKTFNYTCQLWSDKGRDKAFTFDESGANIGLLKPSQFGFDTPIRTGDYIHITKINCGKNSRGI